METISCGNSFQNLSEPSNIFPEVGSVFTNKKYFLQKLCVNYFFSEIMKNLIRLQKKLRIYEIPIEINMNGDEGNFSFLTL